MGKNDQFNFAGWNSENKIKNTDLLITVFKFVFAEKIVMWSSSIRVTSTMKFALFTYFLFSRISILWPLYFLRYFTDYTFVRFLASKFHSLACFP